MNFEERYFHRQTLVLDHYTQQKVRQLKVYVCGLKLVGLEVVKNLVMMGVSSVTLFDNSHVQQQDIESSLYFKSDHIGLPKSQSASSKFKELSHFTSINCSSDNDVTIISSNFDVAVLADYWDYQFTKSLNSEMRRKGKGFITLSNLSLYGFIFIDFGDNHIVSDDLGQIAKKRYIQMISSEKSAVISFAEGEGQFAVGDQIQIWGVKGMKEINGKVAKIISKGQYWSIVNIDTSTFSPYRSGGVACIHRQGVTKATFSSIDDNLKSVSTYQPQRNLVQAHKVMTVKQAVIFKVFFQFYSEKQRLPELLNSKEAAHIKEIASKCLDQMSVDETQRIQIYQIINKLALVGSLQISAFATLWGGIAAQQVMKYTGKFTPINQWLHLDQINIIQNELNHSNNKYSLLFGDVLTRNLSDSKVMMIGAGALGSEIIKMSAEMGIGCNKGLITVVDDDQLNEYNLNRMCLSSKADCGVNKADLLVQKANQLNSSMNLKSIKERLKAAQNKQKQKFPASIWKQHQMVISAVDSHFSRNQIDSYCVKYRKTMLNCGTEDLKCSTEIIIPYLTQRYSAMQDYQGQEMSLPLKGQRHFPYKINNIAIRVLNFLEQLFKVRSQFYELTINKKQCLKRYYDDVKRGMNERVYSQLSNILSFLQIKSSHSFTRCIQQALMKFYQFFYLQVQRILKQRPQDYASEQLINYYFWSGLKSVPQLNILNLNDTLHCEFVFSLATIYANILDIETLNMEETIKIAKELAEIQGYIKKAREQYANRNNDVEELDKVNLQIIKTLQNKQFSTQSRIQFQSNNPSPIHLMLIYSCSILGAKKHQIEQVPRIQIQKLICRAVPTIVSSISISAALLMLQLIKVLKDGRSYSSCRNTYANFAIPRIVQSQLTAPKLQKDKHYDPVMMARMKMIPEYYSQWQQIYLVGPMTVRQLKQHIEDCFKIEVTSIYVQATILLGFNHRINQIVMDMEISNALKELKMLNLQVPIQLIVCGEYLFENETQTSLPLVNYYIPQSQ